MNGPEEWSKIIVMDKLHEIFRKYSAPGVYNHNPSRTRAIEVFAGAVCKIPNHEIGFRVIDPEMMRSCLESDDFETWMKLREEWLSNNES